MVATEKAMAGMKTTTQRKMANIRREIAEIFTIYERCVNSDLGAITRDVQVIFEGLETSKLTKSHREKTDPEKVLEEKIKEMGDIKMSVEDCLKKLKLKKPPQPSDLQSLGSKGKGKVASDYELKNKSPKVDKEMEKILEDASMSKEEEFNGLSQQLKMCLLCFSIFPMDAEIVKRVLIYWWIGEGLVMAKEGKTSEEVGEDCFQELVDREFILPVYNRRRGNILRCRMHPWIRWMIIRLSKKEQFFNFDESGMPSLSPSKSRHARIVSKNEAGTLEEEYCPNLKMPPLLTLFNVNVRYLKLNFGIEALPKLKTLVVLQLGSWRPSSHDGMDVEESKNKDDANYHVEIQGTQFLDRLGDLVHLRYLSLRGISRITKLPSSIGALRNLEIVDLRGCQNVEELTDEIKWLQRLTHLDASDCYRLEHMPKGLSSLTELQVLKGFVFGGYRSRDPCKLADLERLKKLRKLSISIGNQIEKRDIDLHELSKIKGLRSVAITWSGGKIRNLCFPPELVKLDLRCFPEDDLGEWFNPKHLPNLEKLYIRGGKLEKLHLAEKWTKIKMLRLKFLKKLELEAVNIQASFPELEYLEIYECDKIKFSDEIYQLDSDGVWVKEVLDVSTAVAPASAATTTTPEVPPASTAPTTTPEAPPASTAPTTTPEASTASAARATTSKALPASTAPTTTPEASTASAAPTTTSKATPASTDPTTTPEASPASPAPTTTPEAPPASAAPTTTPEASPPSAAPTTTPKAPPASAAPTITPEAPPSSAAPTTTQAPPASAAPTAT